MSSYSTGLLKSTILDSSTHRSKFRTEFKLSENVVYMTDMKLLNLGALSAGANQSYNGLVGAYGLIERITLYDGRQKLDELRHFDMWKAWENMASSNSRNMDYETVQNLGSWGFEFNNLYQSAEKDVSAVATNNLGTTAKGTLDLRKCLPLLRALSILPTQVFKNLRLEIEYQTDARNWSAVDNVDFSNLDPILKVNKVEDEGAMAKLMKTFGSVSFSALEMDEYQLPALPNANNDTGGGEGIPAGTPVVNNQKINGFNGKNIMRMMIIKRSSAYTTNDFDNNTIQGVGQAGSRANQDEALQVRVNGANVLPRTKRGANSLSALVNDTWGQWNMAPANNLVGLGNINNLVNNGNDMSGCAGWLGLYIGTTEPVQDLQIEYTRSALNQTHANLKTNLAQKIVVYCEVPKSLVYKNGEYDLVYN